jgi:hypothetical protein
LRKKILIFEYVLVKDSSIQNVINQMLQEKINWCYDIQEDRFYQVEDLKEIL